MNAVTLIEMPFNLGLRKKSNALEPGVRNLPPWLKKHGFHESVNPKKIIRIETPAYEIIYDEKMRMMNINHVVDYAIKSEKFISESILNKEFLLVLGGDCSIIVGITHALKQKGNYALFYLDGHTDFMESNSSETGAIGGMAAAIAAGIGSDILTNINGNKPYIEEENIWCVGNREYDDEYEDVVRLSKSEYFSLEKLRKEGIRYVAEAFLSKLNEKNLDGFWLHIDVDVLNDDIMPAVDSRTPDGLWYQEFNQLISILLSNSKIRGISITILDPDLDPTGNYTKNFVENFTGVFNRFSK